MAIQVMLCLAAVRALLCLALQKEPTIRGFILSVAMLAAIPQAHSTERDADKLLNALYNALYYDLAVSFFCRDALGVTAYQVTQSRMANTLGAYIGDAQAIVMVNDLDEQLNAAEQ